MIYETSLTQPFLGGGILIWPWGAWMKAAEQKRGYKTAALRSLTRDVSPVEARHVQNPSGADAIPLTSRRQQAGLLFPTAPLAEEELLPGVRCFSLTHGSAAIWALPPRTAGQVPVLPALPRSRHLAPGVQAAKNCWCSWRVNC